MLPPGMHVFVCAMILLAPWLVMWRSGNVDGRFYSIYLLRTSCLILVFYVNYIYLIDRLLFRRKFWPFIIANVCLLVVLAIFTNLFAEMVLRGESILTGAPHRRDPLIPKPLPHTIRVFGENIMLVLVIGMSVALKATMRWYKDSMNLEKVKAAQLEADLKNLRNQLNPHFLFNTLNNIYSLIATDSEKAQESVYRLSHLLRHIAYENDQIFVPVDQELAFTRSYIDLMELRLNREVRLDVLICNEDCTNKIASLMFITLIENAFKHGMGKGKGSFIDIKILVEKDKGVLCTVANSSQGKVKKEIDKERSGIGLANLQKRLELLYPDRHQLEIERKESSFHVLLRVDFFEAYNE